MSIDSIKEILDAFDPASLLPDLTTVVGKVELIARIAVMVGPIIMLILGALYCFASPKEANYHFGYRCYYGMGSVQAWRFTQRMAGIVLGGLGLLLTGIMLVVSGGFASMQTMDMAWKALTCVLWEAGLSAVAILSINIIAAMTFDKRGEYRNRKKKK